MKHDRKKIVSMTHLYYIVHRMHSVRFIAALVALSCTSVGSLIAVFFGATMLTIWLLLASIFFCVVCVIGYRACDEYYEKYLSSTLETPEIKFPSIHKN